MLVITNSTYDGLCYDVRQILAQINGGAKRIHFDEAWYAYAKFNPLYEDRYAMAINVDEDSAPTIFATQSTHKLLAALSQASMIHIKSSPRAPVEHDRFNEAYMMHSSTSPQYAIIASNDVASAMMSGGTGRVLTQESIDEAVAFRQVMARLERDRKEKKDWWFRVWQPDKVRTKRGVVRFEDAESETLRHALRVLEPGAGRGVARLQGAHVRLLPARSHQGHTDHSGDCAERLALRSGCAARPSRRAGAGIHSGSDRHRVPRLGRHRGREDRATTRSCSSSRSASRRGSGVRSSARCSSSSTFTTRARRSPKPFRISVEYYPDRYGGDMTLYDLCLEMHRFLRETQTLPERACVAASGQPAGTAHHGSRGVPGAGQEQGRARADGRTRGARRRGRPRPVPAGHPGAHAGRRGERGGLRVPARRSRRSTTGSPGSSMRSTASGPRPRFRRRGDRRGTATGSTACRRRTSGRRGGRRADAGGARSSKTRGRARA